MTDIVERLRSSNGRMGARDLNDYGIMITVAEANEAANEIERLREKCDKQAMILRRLNPEHFPDTYFICGEMGEKDHNGMPDKIMVAPAYGVDFAYEYVYNGRVRGPEW